ncbi:hypothetical protein DFH08DRAFT_496964 [Mycena albidolilacea]|uniref:Cytochrome P450 n=1 Tax=Mycena albidolilacea TaxID=1033008 RepID=A0AAD7AD20_9AGAR|nr:hypothetical protein DFH08DRAFT_496964 [Mycena albidolilacea]
MSVLRPHLGCSGSSGTSILEIPRGHEKQDNMTRLKLPPYGRYELDWQKIYGPVHRFKGCFGQDRLMISDPVALQYILNSPQFKLGPGPETLVHLLYPKGRIISLTTRRIINESAPPWV